MNRRDFLLSAIASTACIAGVVPNGEEWEFYDLKSDPSEMKSIYTDPAQEKRIEEMKKELQRLRKFYNVPVEQKR